MNSSYGSDAQDKKDCDVSPANSQSGSEDGGVVAANLSARIKKDAAESLFYAFIDIDGILDNVEKVFDSLDGEGSELMTIIACCRQ